MSWLEPVDTSSVATSLSAAAIHPAGTRLLLALALFVVFVAMLPRPAPRPLSVAVLGTIVVVWAFGATLIWGTAGSSKVHFGFVLGTAGGAALLGCATVGTLAGAAALRFFAHGQQLVGKVLGGVFALSFASWSSAVRYTPIVAAIGLITGSAALWWASRQLPDHEPRPRQPPTARLQLPGTALRVFAYVLVPFFSGLLFYAYLRWGPKSWADPECGATLVLPAFIAAAGVSGLGGWFTSRSTGGRTEAVAAATIIATLLAIAICVVAFLIWFGQNQCGE